MNNSFYGVKSITEVFRLTGLALLRALVIRTGGIRRRRTKLGRRS